MTVSAVLPRVVYAGNGAGPDTFSVANGATPISFNDNAEIVVSYCDPDGVISVLVEDTHYTLAGGPLAGVVTRSAGALPDGSKLAIHRSLPTSQETDLVNLGDYSSQDVEDALDYRARVEQDMLALASLALQSDVFGNAYIAGAKRISGLADAVDQQDAVTLAQLTAAALGDVEFGATAITIDPIGDLPGAINVQDALEALAAPESFAAWTIYARNAGTAGAPSAVALAGLAEELSPGTGDKLLGFGAGGSGLKVFDVNNLPGGGGGGGGLNNVVDDTSPQFGGDLDTNGFDLIVKNGDVIRSGNTNGNVLAIGAWDVDGGAFLSMFDIVSGNTPTGNLYTGVTIGSAYVYRSGGTDIPIADGGTGASTAAAAFTALKQLASTTDTGVVEKATTAEVFTRTADKYIDAALLSSSAARVALADAATVAINWTAGINFSLTAAGNRVFGNPTNAIEGTTITVLVKGSDATDRTLTFDTHYGGDLPVITNCDNTQWYLLSIHCVTAGSHYVVTALDASPP